MNCGECFRKESSSCSSIQVVLVSVSTVRVFSGADIGEQQVEPPLITALALDGERLAVGQPVDPRQIDVGVAAQVDEGRGTRVHVGDGEAYEDIGAACRGIALREGGDIVGRDFEALRFLDR